MPTRRSRIPRSSSSRRKAKGASAIDPLAATVAGVTIAAARIIIGQASVAWMAATPRSEGLSEESIDVAAELNKRNEEYWRKLTPAVNLAAVAEVQWASAVGVNDHVAATVAGIVVVAAEIAEKAAHDASVRAQRIWDEAAWATEDLERPLAKVLPREPASPRDEPKRCDHETREQALNRVNEEIEKHDAETLAPPAGGATASAHGPERAATSRADPCMLAVVEPDRDSCEPPVRSLCDPFP